MKKDIRINDMSEGKWRRDIRWNQNSFMRLCSFVYSGIVFDSFDEF